MTGPWFLIAVALFAGGLPGSSASGGSAQPDTELQEQVGELQAQARSTEQAFAKTMADRDHEAFSSFIADEAIFFGAAGPLRGKQAVADGWKLLFDGPQAPFSWEPDVVEVLDSGTLAFNPRPIRDLQGNTVGTYSSVWCRDAGGKWLVVFDRGCPAGSQ
jgi:ketosteroid isomerase-like protein